MLSSISPRRMLVDRLPYLAIAAAMIALYRHRQDRQLATSASADPGSPPECLPPPKSIDWVKAAGNYVEIRSAGRTRLVRTTLRQVAELLPSSEFVQIHRSVIINRARLSAVRAGRAELTDGSSFNVGDAYRSNLAGTWPPIADSIMSPD